MSDVIQGTKSVIGSLKGTISVYTGESQKESYDGEYSVTPSTDEDVVLKTKDKIMSDDLTVKKIPYEMTSNDSEGITVYIGKEVEITNG